MQDHVHILGRLIERIMTEDAQDLECDIRVSIILIGSFQSSKEVNDIDLILIYDKFNMNKLKELKIRLANSIYDHYKVPLHYTTLSAKEYNEMTQLHEEKHMCIYEGKAMSMK